MKTFGELLKHIRESKGLLLREVAAKLEVDPSFLSKVEKGDKRPTRGQVLSLAKIFGVDEKDLLIQFLSEKVMYQLQDEELAMAVLKVAEKKVKYLKNKK